MADQRQGGGDRVLVRTELGYNFDVSTVEGLKDVPLITPEGVEVSKEQAEHIRSLGKEPNLGVRVHTSQVKENNQ